LGRNETDLVNTSLNLASRNGETHSQHAVNTFIKIGNQAASLYEIRPTPNTGFFLLKHGVNFHAFGSFYNLNQMPQYKSYKAYAISNCKEFTLPDFDEAERLYFPRDV